MLRKVQAYVETCQMLKREDKIVVGVSGGADSVCLLFVLIELQKKYGFEMVAVHINHGLRGEEAKRDEEYVKRICEENSIPALVYFENVELLAKKRKQSIEEAGRDIRREIFMKVSKEQGGTKIALAHHKNDNAETMLLNLARGTGLQGLGGMQPINGMYIRPLLCVTRREIEEYLKGKAISYCMDTSNKSDCYTRNRIRNKILPLLETEVNARALDHIEDAMAQLREVQQFLEKEADKRREDCVQVTEEGTLLLAEPFAKLPFAMQSVLVKKELTRAAGQAKDLGKVHFVAILELMKKQVGRRVDLPYELFAKREYEGVLLAKKKEEDAREDMELFLEPEEGKEKETLFRGRRITCRIYTKEEWKEKSLENSGSMAFDYDIIEGVLFVRTRRQGDYITISESGGTQKLKSYFVNEKIEQSKREQIPVLADGNHIVWIVGYRINPKYRVSERTKRVLAIKVEGEQNGQ